jgi:hypothetical protein
MLIQPLVIPWQLYGCAKDWFRPYKWKAGALISYFISDNAHISWHPYR